MNQKGFYANIYGCMGEPNNIEHVLKYEGIHLLDMDWIIASIAFQPQT